MKVIHHQDMTRDTMVEEERRGENIKETRACTGIRMKEERGIEAERGILKEVGKERGAQKKREKQRGGVFLLPLLGHAAVTSSNLQEMTAEVRRYGKLQSLICADVGHLVNQKYILEYQMCSSACRTWQKAEHFFPLQRQRIILAQLRYPRDF